MTDLPEEIKKLLSALQSGRNTQKLPGIGVKRKVKLANDPKERKNFLTELKANLKRTQRSRLSDVTDRASDNESSNSETEEDDEESEEDDEKTDAFLAAVQMENRGLCDLLLQTGVNVNSRGPNKITALHIAAHEDKPDIVNMLLSRGADVNAVDKDGDSPLMVSVIKKNQTLINIFIDRGTDLRIKNKLGFTAADLAFLTENQEALEQLEKKQKALQFDVKVHDKSVLSLVAKKSTKLIQYWLENFPSLESIKPCDLQYKDGRTIAFAAALNGSSELLELIDKYGGNLDLPDKSNSSPLFCAAQNGFTDIIKILLNKGCDVNRINHSGRTALFSAITNNHTNIAKMLVEAKADINVKDKNGICPLAWCIMAGSQEIFKFLLIEKKADSVVTDNYGHDLILLAASFKQFEIIKLLHEFELPLDRVCPKDNETALLTACQVSSPEIVRFLIENGCNVNQINKKGVTAVLRAATQTWNLETVKLLAKHGARLNVPNKQGDVAILVAAQNKSIRIVKFLIEKGCDVSSMDDKHNSLALHAAKTNSMELLDLIVENSGSLDIPNYKGNTPLMVTAIQPDKVDMLSKLIELKCNVNAKNVKGNTATSIAAKNGNIEALKVLIKAGGNMLNITTTGKTIIMQVAKAKQLDVLKMIAKSKDQPDVNGTDKKRRTAVHYAAIGGNLDIVEFLICDMKADFDSKDTDGFTPFMLACINGNKVIVEKLQDLGSDINLRNMRGENSAHLAVKGNHLDVLKYLSQKMCHLDQEDNAGVTPLMIACRRDNLEMVNFLLSKKCSIESVARNGRQIIHEACESGSLAVARRIINLDLPVDVVDTDDVTALMLAAKAGSVKKTKALIDRKKELVKMRDASGRTALEYAIEKDRMKVVQLLISAGCDVNNVMQDGRTSLLLAIEHCVRENEGIVRLLIEKQSKVDIATTNSSLNAAQLACKFNKLLSLKILIDKGVPLDIITNDGDSSLTLAMVRGSPEMIRLLIDLGMDRNHTNSHGHSAVSLACQRGDEAILSIVLPLQIEDITRSYSGGNSLLHFACEGGSVKLVENLLTEHGISPDITNEKYETSLHVATRCGHQELVALLLKHGANVNALDKKGETPIFSALDCSGRQEEAMRLRKHKETVGAHASKDNVTISNSIDLGNEEICRLLINAGANLNVINKNEVCLLAKAYYHGNCSLIRLLKSEKSETVQLSLVQLPSSYDVFCRNLKSLKPGNVMKLLSEGLPVDRREGNGHLLHHAIRYCRSDAIDLLLAGRPNLRAKDDSGSTPLMVALQSGRVDVAEKIISQDSKTIEDVNDSGNTILHVVIECGKAKTLQWILKKTNTPNLMKDIRNKDGLTALHLAVLQGNKSILEILVKGGWNPRLGYKVDKKWWNIMHLAAQSGNMSFVKFLHDKRLLSNVKWTSILELIAKEGQLKMLQWLCETTGENLEDVSFLGVRNAAFQFGHEAIATWLIDRGVDMERGDKENGMAAISTSVQGGNFHLVRELTKKDVSLSVRDVHGTSLVQLAVLSNHEPLLRYLLRLGCPIDEADQDGDTAFLKAIYCQRPKLLKLLQSEANHVMKRENKLQRNAVHVAAIVGNVEILNYLKKLLSETVFDACDLHKDSPLMLAVLYSQANAARFLLDNFRLDIDNQNETGSTALHWAALNSDKTLTSLLLEKQAKVDTVDQDGSTPLMLAVQEKSVECVRILLENGASATLRNRFEVCALDLMQISGDSAMREFEVKLRLELGIQNSSGETAKKEIERRQREFEEKERLWRASEEERRKIPPYLEKWDTMRLLGRGAFGDVHEVLTDKGIKCAAKTIRLPFQQGKMERDYEKVIDAEKNLCKLIHRNIVSFLWMSQQDANLVVFMEFLDGVTLDTLIDGKALDDDKIVGFGTQICKALIYMHSQQPPVIHRDIKCSNIMVSTDGEHIKLIDFGLSMNLMSGTHYTASSFTPKGTMNFMAPELFGSESEMTILYSPESDIWAFGCSVYQMATGSVPYADFKNPYAFPDLVMKRGAPALPDSCSKELKNFYSCCIARDRKKRKCAADLLRNDFLTG